MEVVSTDTYSYGTACVRCNYTLIAPDWSEYVSEHQVRHSWSCESCGNQFETLDDVHPPQDSDVACRIKGKSPYRIQSPGTVVRRGFFHATPVVGGLGVDQRDITYNT